MENNLKQTLDTIFKTDERLLDKHNELMYNKIHDLIDKTDEKLIGLLIQNQALREQFFIKIKDVFVFKTTDFKFFIDENKIDNSYTEYENRIGLTAGRRFLKDSADVVLDFPYKDCILEGGQSTDEGLDTYFEYNEKDDHYTEKQAKRKEIFFNTVLAKDEIDRLLEPKAFTNFKHYVSSTDKLRLVPKFERDENGTIKDNLIIKGNNLLALHSIKTEFAGKVKLIYIDPPYNTGNDSFAYNDNFNHSTWLTFMRNRLLVAKELLREDGVIFIQCDDNEQAYLKILMDEIFVNGFINNIVVEMSNLSGNKIEHAIQGRKFPKIKEYIFLYAKNKSEYKLDIPKSEKEKWDDEYNMIIPNLDIEKFNIVKKYILDGEDKQLNDILSHLDLVSLNKYSKDNDILLDDNWKFNNSYRIVASKPNTALRKKALNLTYNHDLFALKNQRGDLKIIKTDFNRDTDTARIEIVFAEDNSKIFFGDIWFNIVTTGGVAQEGGVVLKNGKKPEYLLHKIIFSATKKDDIILDYHLGSGTTAAVAHKMQRQYIGVEQMDNQVNLSKTRLQNVINNDQTGISKSVNWQGGGSFVYLELAKNNQNAIDQIQACESYERLVTFFETMCNKYFLHYNVKVKDFRDVVCKEDNFKKLTLDQQKTMFAKMLDLNQLYVNVSDMENTKFNLSENDMAITKDFYQQ